MVSLSLLLSVINESRSAWMERSIMQRIRFPDCLQVGMLSQTWLWKCSYPTTPTCIARPTESRCYGLCFIRPCLKNRETHLLFSTTCREGYVYLCGANYTLGSMLTQRMCFCSVERMQCTSGPLPIVASQLYFQYLRTCWNSIKYPFREISVFRLVRLMYH